MATHWKIVERGDERAIAVVSFSCPEAGALRPPAPRHVRADLIVSMYLLRPIFHDDEEKCRLTRLVSFDLAGTVHQHLSNVVSTQQASLPAVIEEYFQRHEPVVENRYRGLLSNESVVTTVIKRLKQKTANGLHDMARPSSTLNMDDDCDNDADNIDSSVGRSPPLEAQAVVLLAPSLLHYLMNFFRVPFATLGFCFCAFLAIRRVVIWHLGETLPLSDEAHVLGPVTCRFAVPLKGVLRFIANKREERDELSNSHADVSIVHIVACALARALKKETTLHIRRVSIPWLLIDKVVHASSEPVDVSVSENGGGIVTLKGVDSQTIQDIADGLSAAEDRTNKTKEVGQCLVLAVSNDGQSEMVTDAAPVHRNIAVVAVVGGVHLEHPPQAPRSSGVNSMSPCPVLSLSLTITGHRHTDIVTCRRFADEVRKLLVYPEICDSE